MKIKYYKKSLIMILILLFANSIIPGVQGNILKINYFENKNNHYENRNDSISPNLVDVFSKSKDSIYLVIDKFGFHNYLFTTSDLNNDPDYFQNLNYRKFEQKNNIISENNNQKIVKKEIQKSLKIDSGNIFYVGGTGPNNYSSIQDAINDSFDGDTVFVYDDSSPYFENIIINKSINLLGENKDSTEINGSKLNEFLDTVNITVDNVYVNGFSINNNPGYYYQAAVKILGDHAVITNCNIHDNQWIGISLIGSSNSQIFDCELFKNLMAIHMVDSDENEINKCYCYYNAEDIILFQNSNYNKITNCTCIGNSFSGIHVQRSTGNQIINCTCRNGYGGISFAYAPNSIMHGNTINNNYENFGIGSTTVSDFYCDIDTTNKINGKPIYYWVDHHNQLVPSDASFIGLISCTNISVKNLQISNNFQAVVCSGSLKCTIEDCNFLNNEGHGVYFIFSQNNIIKNCSYKNSFYSGIFLCNQTDNNVILNNNISNIQVCGLWCENSVNNNISNNNIKNPLKGILLDKSGNSFLRNDIMENCGLVVDGISISDYEIDVDTSNKVNNKTLYYHINKNNLLIPSDAGEVILVNCTKCNITNLNLSNATIGIELAFSSYNNISENIINNNRLVAIDLDCSNNNYNIIKQNLIIDNNYGIDIDFSDNNTITNNKLQNNGVGLSFDSCKGNIVSENDIKNSFNGIYLSKSSNNNLNENIIKDCSFNGIYLLFSKNNIVRKNKMINCGLLVYGSTISEYINNVDTSNKVNNKTLYYYIDKNNLLIPSDAGEVILVNSIYCNITNLELSNGTIGIELAYCSFITISKNKLNNNKFAGIYIESSANNIVEKNTIQENGYGINQQLANNNKIKNNYIRKNSYGCYLYLSNINTIFLNNIFYNSYGIILKSPSDNNTIYYNNLIGNGYNAWDENEKTNNWYNIKKGNYWGDYKIKYPDAKKKLLKGVWDKAYEIPNKQNKDVYPLLKPIILSNEKTKTQVLINFLKKLLTLTPQFFRE